MSVVPITPVILCGGSGTRLWPLSRKSYPKQFVDLVGDETLFQASALRLSGDGAGLRFRAPLVLTNSDFRFIVTEQLQAVGIDPGAILIEPEGRNTAPAILAAALYAHQEEPEAVLLVAPSDHVVPDRAAFHRAVATGLAPVAAVLFTQSRAAVKSRTARHIAGQFRDNVQIDTFDTEIHERDAFAAMFAMGGTVADMAPTQVNGLPKALANIEDFRAEVVAKLRAIRDDAAGRAA